MTYLTKLVPASTFKRESLAPLDLTAYFAILVPNGSGFRRDVGMSGFVSWRQ